MTASLFSQFPSRKTLSAYKRRLKCRVLGHAGPIETAKARTDRHDLAVRFVRCSRCGDIHGVDIEPYDEMVQRITGVRA